MELNEWLVETEVSRKMVFQMSLFLSIFRIRVFLSLFWDSTMEGEDQRNIASIIEQNHHPALIRIEDNIANNVFERLPAPCCKIFSHHGFKHMHRIILHPHCCYKCEKTFRSIGAMCDHVAAVHSKLPEDCDVFDHTIGHHRNLADWQQKIEHMRECTIDSIAFLGGQYRQRTV